jgi:hypothetical protein
VLYPRLVAGEIPAFEMRNPLPLAIQVTPAGADEQR